MEILKLADLRQVFGWSFCCNIGRIVALWNRSLTEHTAQKASKADSTIIAKLLIAQLQFSFYAIIKWIAAYSVLNDALTHEKPQICVR